MGFYISSAYNSVILEPVPLIWIKFDGVECRKRLGKVIMIHDSWKVRCHFVAKGVDNICAERAWIWMRTRSSANRELSRSFDVKLWETYCKGSHILCVAIIHAVAISEKLENGMCMCTGRATQHVLDGEQVTRASNQGNGTWTIVASINTCMTSKWKDSLNVALYFGLYNLLRKNKSNNFKFF